jgi:hypothetical protein
VSTDRPAQGNRTRAQRRESEPPARATPHDLDAEAGLLGAAMVTSDALEVVATKVRPEDFFRPAHQHIAAALTSIYEEAASTGETVGRASPADGVTVGSVLRSRGLLEDVGGGPAVLELIARAPAATLAPRYAGIVHDLATLRRLIGSASEIAELGYGWNGASGTTEDVHAAVLKAQALVGDVAANNGTRSYSSLDFGDVDALLAGTIPRIDPDFLVRSDGRALFYAGRMHSIHGEPTAGKTWVALAAVLEVLRMGGAVLYLDYEDSLAGIVSRLLALGAEPEHLRERFVYLRQDGPFGPAEKTELANRLRGLNPDLVIIDGVAEALSRDGLKEDLATDIVEWTERLPRWLARTGAAVVMLDHVAKDRESRGRWSRGSGAKLGAIDGAAYEARVLVGFSRSRAGKSELRVAKDRHGTYEVGAVAAVAVITPHADGERVVVDIEPPEIATTSVADAWKPTRIMRRVSDELEQAVTPLTARAVKDLVGGKPRLTGEAIARLVSEGWVVEYRIGSAKYLRLARPYREVDEPPPPDPEMFGDAVDPEFGPYTPPNVVRGPWAATPDDDPEQGGPDQ